MSLRHAAAAFVVLLMAPAVFGATITVTTAADDVTANDGSVSLREAIVAINAGGTTDTDITSQSPGTFGVNDTVHFAIPGSGVHTIVVTSQMGLLKPVVIDGYTQPGASPNTLASGSNAAIQVALDGQGFVPIAFLVDATSTVRGLSLVRFTNTAIFIDTASNCVITGNFIGVMPDGTTAAPASTGIFMTGGGNSALPAATVIGGSAPADRNLIVASTNGILAVSGDSAVVAGNLLGTDQSGTVELTPHAAIRMTDATNTTVGGTSGTTPGGVCSGACNLATGGIAISSGTVQGNFVGVDRTGSSLRGDGGLAAGGNGGATLVGGTSPAARNVVGEGITVSNIVVGEPVTIQGNYVGTNSAGTASLGGSATGIDLTNAPNVLIGGTVAGAGNVVSGNGSTLGMPLPGIHLGSAAGTMIQSNLIGVGADGTTPIGNAGAGIFVDSVSVTIGATTAGGPGANVIANNGSRGVVTYASSATVRILDNSIYNNVGATGVYATVGLGIDVGNDGVTPNTPCNTAGGQNHPVLAAAVVSGGQTTISGVLNSKPNTTYTLEFFTDPTSIIAQGKTLIGFTTVTTAANCTATFSVSFPAIAPGSRVTATATNLMTSEFSDPIIAGLPLSIAKSFAPSSVPATFGSTLTVTLTNPNAFPLTGVGFTDTYPAGLVNATATTSTTCGGTASATQGGNALTFSGGTIPANGTCAVMVSVSAPTSGSYTNSIPASAVTSAVGSPTAGASATLTVMNAVPALSPAALLLLALALAATAFTALRR